MEPASPNLRQWLRNAAQRYGITAFWRWWSGELMPLLPVAARTALRRRRLRPIVAFERNEAVLWAPRVANGALAFVDVARIPLGGDPLALAKEGHAAIEALPRATYGGNVTETRVVVALPPNQVLRKTITLPAAVEEDLQQALRYDLDRHTPFKPDEVYFDAVVVGRDPVKKEIRVDWAAAQKSIVDPARRHVESWGATIVGVIPESPTGDGALPATKLNLLPAAERPDTSMWRRWELWVPLALIAVVAVAATALPVWQKRGYAIGLMRQAEQARIQADASSALRDEIERLTNDYNFALQRKYAFPAAVQVVDDVTKLLPDDTWLTQFEMKTTARGKDPHREVVLRGESANAGRLVSLLEESKIFEQAAPRSPTTKIQPGPGEIFDLGAQLKTLPMPASIQTADAGGDAGRPASSPMMASPGTAGAPGTAAAVVDAGAVPPPKPAEAAPGASAPAPAGPPAIGPPPSAGPSAVGAPPSAGPAAAGAPQSAGPAAPPNAAPPGAPPRPPNPAASNPGAPSVPARSDASNPPAGMPQVSGPNGGLSKQ